MYLLWALRVSVVSSLASFLELPRRHGDHGDWFFR
jgi:hypothetical protein